MRRGCSARRAFGGVEQAKELQRDARAFRWIADLRQDMAYGVRSFARNPGFTAAAIVTLALGIGAATTIFGALYAIGLRPLPYADPDRIVRVFEYLPPRDAVARRAVDIRLRRASWIASAARRRCPMSVSRYRA